ncbi:APO protein 2, chloroplastic [Mercurialis annua]|uniref:APO protein 2, chloroplastic n=1 Tax=Mercurialis annua TaxID=3986 RepID=UPI00215FAF07|nr:APO protein 2, chloroplastic [Mercurialis annua]XP_050214528.1 APO protein 2, chloroplastic [Mercurialis annua]
MPLLGSKLTVSHSNMEACMVSCTPKSQFLQFNLYPALSSLDFFQSIKLKHKLKSVIISRRKFWQPHALVIASEQPQNSDFPRYYSRKEKKPFPVPIVELRRAARQRLKERLKNKKGQPRGRVPPPKNGMVIKSLVPVAYDLYNSRIILINNLKKLLEVVPVHACGWCNEIHVGPLGHPFKSCKGKYATLRKGNHEWIKAAIEDVLVPIEAYHLFDRLQKRITHEERFSIPRIPAVLELCIQAGVNIPEYPTKRRRKPIIRISKHEFVDADESDLPDPVPEYEKPLLMEIPKSEIVVPSDEEVKFIADETIRAWEKMRKTAKRLMGIYFVRVCGYCPEVHVGPSGHKAQNCGAHKHQQRNGQHGWQAAVLNDLIPPRYVWHVPNVNEPLQRELRNFYGQAPAVVEICIQAGAVVPEEYKSTMRLDIGIPSSVSEADMVV